MVGDLRHPAGGIADQVEHRLAGKSPGSATVCIQRGNSFFQAPGFGQRFKIAEVQWFGRLVVHGLRVQGENFLADFLVKPFSRFCAEDAVIHHLDHQFRGAVRFAAFIMGDCLVEVLSHIFQGIQPDHIGGAEGGGFGMTDQGAGQGVDFFDGIFTGSEGADRLHDRISADPVGDEVGGILGDHHAFSQVYPAEPL